MMLGDYFTKPLQGVLFCQFHDALMNFIDPNALPLDHRCVLHPQNQLQVTKVTADHNLAQAQGQAQGQAQELHVGTMTVAGWDTD